MHNEDNLIDKYFKEKFNNVTSYEVDGHRRDWENKEKTGQGLLEDFIKRVGGVKGKKIMDVGFGNGVVALVFAKAGAEMYGIEVDKNLLSIAREFIKNMDVGIHFDLYDGEIFPYNDNFFDYAYSTSVIEHVTNKDKFLMEVFRTLRPGGRFYLAFPNRFAPKETHTGIYGLSYLPRKIAKGLLDLVGRTTIDDWNLYFLSFFWLKRTLKKNNIPFSIVFETDSRSVFKVAVKKILALLGVHYTALLSHIIVILEKPKNKIS